MSQSIKHHWRTLQDVVFAFLEMGVPPKWASNLHPKSSKAFFCFQWKNIHAYDMHIIYICNFYIGILDRRHTGHLWPWHGGRGSGERRSRRGERGERWTAPLAGESTSKHARRGRCGGFLHPEGTSWKLNMDLWNTNYVHLFSFTTNIVVRTLETLPGYTCPSSSAPNGCPNGVNLSRLALPAMIKLRACMAVFVLHLLSHVPA